MAVKQHAVLGRKAGGSLEGPLARLETIMGEEGEEGVASRRVSSTPMQPGGVRWMLPTVGDSTRRAEQAPPSFSDDIGQVDSSLSGGAHRGFHFPSRSARVGRSFQGVGLDTVGEVCVCCAGAWCRTMCSRRRSSRSFAGPRRRAMSHRMHLVSDACGVKLVCEYLGRSAPSSDADRG